MNNTPNPASERDSPRSGRAPQFYVGPYKNHVVAPLQFESLPLPSTSQAVTSLGRNVITVPFVYHRIRLRHAQRGFGFRSRKNAQPHTPCAPQAGVRVLGTQNRDIFFCQHRGHARVLACATRPNPAFERDAPEAARPSI